MSSTIEFKDVVNSTYVDTETTNAVKRVNIEIEDVTGLNSVITAVGLNTAKVSNVDHPLVEKAVPSDALFTDTTYTVEDGGLSEKNFTTADNTKLDGIETGANVTDTDNVTAAGALMDSEVTNLAQVKAFDSTDYATSAQGTKADAALPKAGGAMTGAITTTSTFDGRDVATDGTKLDTIATSANNYSHPANHAISVITGLQTALDGKVDDSQVLTDVPAGAVFTDTLTSLTLVGNNLTYTDEDGASVVHDLTLYLDDTNLAVLVSGVYNAPTQELIFTRDDGSTFTVDASMFFDDTNLVTSVSGRAGVVTLTKVDVGLGNVDNTSDLDKPISTATQTALDDTYPLVATPTIGNLLLFASGDTLADSGKDLDNLVTQTSPVASAQLPAGTTAQRDSTPTNGMIRYNADDDSFEGYVNGAWGAIGGSGGATGGGSDDSFYENSQHVTQSYELTAGKNAMSAGPITIDDGATVTIPDGAVWTIV